MLLRFIYIVMLPIVAASLWTNDMNNLRATSTNIDRTLQVAGVGQVTGFRLVNATVGNRGQILIDPLLNGAVVDLTNYPLNQGFSIEAVTSTATGPIGSVRFGLLNRTNFKTEGAAPYVLCGNTGASFTACSFFNVGSHTYFATPFSNSSAKGVMGTRSSVSFTIVKSVRTPAPTSVPSKSPSASPFESPSKSPSGSPFESPSKSPSGSPFESLTKSPSKYPTTSPFKSPSNSPSESPSRDLPAGWIEVNPNATIDARHEACFVMVGRKAYLIAGRDVRPVNIYDPVSRTWTNGPAPPIRIHHTQCIAVDDSIWIVSPWTGGYPMEKNVGDIHIYNTTTNTWSKRPGLPSNRQRGGAAVILVPFNGTRRIYVSHGNRGGHETSTTGDGFATSLNWLDYYDIDKRLWVTNLTDAPHIRDHTGGAYVNGRICVAGGRDGGDVDFFSKVILPTNCYDPVTNTWSVEANIPQGRAGSSYGTTCDGKLMVAGGEGPSSAYTNVDVFDGTTWTTVDSLNVPRHGSGLAVDCICKQIHIASGARTRGGRYEIKSVETYFPNGVDVPCPA